MPLILSLDNPSATIDQVGGKGASLARLAQAGLPVPPGFHITTHAYRYFISENRLSEAVLSLAARADPGDPAGLERLSAEIQSLFTSSPLPADLAALILEWYARLGADDPPVAVRSSATAEDLPGLSFAGQQETFLNLRGGEHLLEAVRRCWASLWTARDIVYRVNNHILPGDIALAVVVQRLIPAEAAGIIFTANPVTGSRDQVLINAAWGLGEAIVGGQVSPDTIVLDKQSHAIQSQEIAAKEIMTVRALEGTRQEPVPPEKRSLPALTGAQAARLSRLAVQIEQLYQLPVDIEWVLNDEKFSILQARPITALPEPAEPLEWKLPRPNRRYLRQNVIELLPDPLSPLFASLGLSAWNQATHHLGQSVGLRLPEFMPEQLLTTINDYAYLDFNLSLRQTMQYLRALPVLVKGFSTAQQRWAVEARPRYVRVVARWAGRDKNTLPAGKLLEGAREIMQTAAKHYLTIQSGILPMSKISETFFPILYNRLFKRKFDPPVLAFMLGFDSTPIQAEESLYDLAMWARIHPELASYLNQAGNAEIVAAFRSSIPPISDLESWREFTRRFQLHLDRFGHAIYDLDFAKPVPEEDPLPLLDPLKYFLTGQAHSPYERQAESASAREQATQSMLGRLKGWRLRFFTRLLRWAQRYVSLREDALADVGLGWSILRGLLLELGRRLAGAHAIAASSDVFWLKMDELQTAANALDARQSVQEFHNLVSTRRLTWERERTLTPPVNLPLKGGARFWGIDWSFTSPAQTGQAASSTIKGIAASPGSVRGIARVIHDPGEFSQMQPGDILVARITTPAWTPLFAMASGVVTDVGGLLSHSSIVAREYHIPSVLGTGVATTRIQSGQPITVDGDKGLVLIN